jgi:16S rRNA (cytosine1402-N4)-methyltransferase
VSGAEHVPVLFDEVMSNLQIKGHGVYVDCTFGRGGHSRGILQRLGPTGRVLALDRDADAVAAGHELAASDSRFSINQAAFSALADVLSAENLVTEVDGVVIDLGVSSPQLEHAERGFSFMRDGPLDMRMDRTQKLTAASWLHTARERELAEVLKTYGEERFARRIAKAIIAERTLEPITTTQRLADIVKAAHPAWEPGFHPATRVFQALRIFVNRELDELQAVLPQALQVLAAGGRLAVISFHSLEDRIVKRFLRTQAKGDEFPPGLPVTVAQLRPRLRLIGKALRPTTAEVEANPRSRSAVLRVAEKLI